MKYGPLQGCGGGGVMCPSPYSPTSQGIVAGLGRGTPGPTIELQKHRHCWWPHVGGGQRGAPAWPLPRLAHVRAMAFLGDAHCMVGSCERGFISWLLSARACLSEVRCSGGTSLAQAPRPCPGPGAWAGRCAALRLLLVRDSATGRIVETTQLRPRGRTRGCLHLHALCAAVPCDQVSIGCTCGLASAQGSYLNVSRH